MPLREILWAWLLPVSFCFLVFMRWVGLFCHMLLLWSAGLPHTQSHRVEQHGLNPTNQWTRIKVCSIQVESVRYSVTIMMWPIEKVMSVPLAYENSGLKPRLERPSRAGGDRPCCACTLDCCIPNALFARARSVGWGPVLASIFRNIAVYMVSFLFFWCLRVSFLPFSLPSSIFFLLFW